MVATERQVFADAVGRRWFLRVDWAAMRRAKAVGVDLSRVEEQLGDFARGSLLLADTIWAVVSDAAADCGVSKEQFESGLTGEAMERGRVALLEGVEDFFPSGRAELIRAAATEVDAEIQSLRDRLRKPSTESPERSESIPPDSPCAS